MSARSIIDSFDSRVGWDDNSKIELLCQYIDNQQSDDALQDFLEQQAQEEEGDAVAKLNPDVFVSSDAEAIVNFFGVEVRNEEQGGDSPANLQSALDSLKQADNATIIEWCDDDTVRDAAGVERFKKTIEKMVETYGGTTELENWID